MVVASMWFGHLGGAVAWWPLLLAVDKGRWYMIRWGVRPGIVVSLEF
jgi:hypothetical protein